jgi:hypothetical protein
MTTRDTETIYRIFGLEHEGDIALFPYGRAST